MKLEISKDKNILKQYDGNSSIVVLPDGIKQIARFAFYKNEDVDEIIFPKSVLQISEQAIYNCKRLSAIRLYKLPEKSSGCIICNCPNIKESIVVENTLLRVPLEMQGTYIVPLGVKYISKNAFCGCDAIEELIIPNGVECISVLSTKGMKSLKTLQISATVKYIENNLLGESNVISRIVVDEDNKTYDSRENCNAIVETKSDKIVLACNKTVFDESIKTIGTYSFTGCNLSLLNIPCSINRIETCAFWHCNSLQHINIQDGVKYIGEDAFDGCIKTLVVPDSVTLGGSIGLQNEIIECPIFNKKYFIALPQSYNGNYTVPSGIIYINDFAFFDCYGVTSILLQEGIESIGEYAFSDCTMLENLVLPNSIKKIKNNAFDNCKSLKKIILPQSLDHIEDETFKDCVSLEEIIIPNKTTSIGARAFSGCYSLKYVYIPQSVETIKTDAFYGCINIDEIYIPLKWKKLRTKIGLMAHNQKGDIYGTKRMESLTDIGVSPDGPMVCTEGRIRPCPYCGGDNTSTYIDGSSQCNTCYRWFRYTPTGW